MISFSRRLAPLATCLFLLAAAMAPAVAQERQVIPGTTVSLTPPAGFAPAKGFAGLQNTGSGASVVIMELPAEAHDKLAPLFADMEAAKTNFARQQLTIADRVELDTGAGRVPVLTGSQEAGGATFAKWIALFKGAKTVMLTVQSPLDANLDGEAVKTLIKSVSLGAEPGIAEKIGALPFTVAAAEPFRIVDTIGGAGILMTAGPLDADPSGRQPVLIVASQLAGAQGAPLDKLSEAALKQTRGFQAAKITTREKKPFAGTEGYLLAGTDDAGKRFEHYLATGPDGRFVRLIAMADAAQFDKLKPGIAKVAASIAFRAN